MARAPFWSACLAIALLTASLVLAGIPALVFVPIGYVYPSRTEHRFLPSASLLARPKSKRPELARRVFLAPGADHL
jgi:hypothetical protein